jgi:hypothetical protein
MLLTALLTCVYILTGTFRSLLTFIGITEYLIFLLTVLAIFRLRLHPPPSCSPAVNPPLRRSIELMLQIRLCFVC